ncbi:MAG: PEP-CTERM sorting domain-containing protein [Anaerohalosphaera sp.]|nr:PEP-CTERM sorting domain-containing protein [Anaerohalosphaera sp.]
MMKRLFCLGCLFLFCSIVNAGVTVYTGSYSEMGVVRSQWLLDIGIAAPDTTLDFESGFSQDQNILNVGLAGGLTVSSTSGYAYVTNSSSDTGGSLPIGTYGVAIDEGDNYTFSFSSQITYFAFYMYDQGTTGMNINYADGTSETVTIPPSGASGLNGKFMGLVSDKNIASLYIPRVNGGDGEVGMDNLEFGYVPEPASLTLMSLGVLTLIRRKS